MEDWIRSLRGLILDNLRRNGMPLPIDRAICSGWASGLAEGGKRVLYTSCMYQLAPLIARAVDLLQKVGASSGGLRARLAAAGAKLFGGLVLKPSDEEARRAENILKNIAAMLAKTGVQFGVLKDEPYSGALLYELGFEDDFASYAREVYRYFKERGVEEVITVDPHTHYTLERLYPKYVDGFDLKVVSYMDLIRPSKAVVNRVVIHDSCLYARFLDRYDTYRRLLDSVGVAHVEDPYVTGKAYSGCCGGPVESVRPDVAGEVAKIRVRQLSRLSDVVVTVCPICYVNLSRAASGLKIYDLAEVIS
ncbi:MAG: (Fe-S)-binding protein [Thermoproteus sp.]